MTVVINATPMQWSFLRKITFRFLFIYIALYISPWAWLDGYVGIFPKFNDYYYNALEWIINLLNKWVFHFAKTTIQNNGSGDSSIDFETVFTLGILALVGAIIWSVFDRKRNTYHQASYWLRTFTRYFLMLNCFFYGIIKLYALQMPFPQLSQLATPLGDFLPMRLSWMFIGYSGPYQMFSGFMEILAGLFLFNRKTITLGLLLALSVFVNVMVLNLSYDIPVKLFSMHLVVFSLYLLLQDTGRIVDFFLHNRPAKPNSIDQVTFPKKWMRISRWFGKVVFFLVFFVLVVLNQRDRYLSNLNQQETLPFASGIYDVTVFSLNGDTIPDLNSDTLRWKDIIFHKNGSGSVNSTDKRFRQVYRRGYFLATADTSVKFLEFKKFMADSQYIARFKYSIIDNEIIRLTGNLKTDSLFVLLKRSNRHFQLAEKQFHWISEANR